MGMRGIIKVIFVFLVQISAAQASDQDREAFRTFFRGLLAEKEKPYEDTQYREIIDYIWKAFYKGEKFSEEALEDGITKHGVVTLQFELPECAVVGLPATIAKALDGYILNKVIKDTAPTYCTGLLGCVFDVDINARMLMTKVQIYQDKRQSRLINLYRLYMPTQIAPLQLDYDTYRSQFMHGFLVEWMVLMGQSVDVWEHPFSKFIQEQLSARFTNNYATYFAQLSQLQNELKQYDPRFTLDNGGEYLALKGSGYEQLVGRVKAYNAAFYLKRLPSVIEQDRKRLYYAGLLHKPISSQEDIFKLFRLDQGFLEFVLGDEALPIYLERFGRFSIQQMLPEAQILMKHLFANIAKLLKRKTQRVEGNDLAAFEVRKCNEIKDSLLWMYQALNDIAPQQGRRKIVFTKGNLGALEVASKRRSSQGYVINRGSVMDIVSSLFSIRHIRHFFSRFEFGKMPYIVEDRGSLFMVNLSEEQVEQLQKRFPQYAKEMTIVTLIEKNCKGLKIMPASFLNIDEQEQLESLWADLFCQAFAEEGRRQKQSMPNLLVSLLSQLNDKMKESLHLTLVAMGIKELPPLKWGFSEKRYGELPDQVTPFLNLLEKMRVEVFSFFAHVQANVELFEMIKEVHHMTDVGRYKQDILKIIMEKSGQHDLAFLSMYARIFLVHYQRKPFEHPLGKDNDERLVPFLACLLKSVQDEGMVHDEKTVMAYISTIKEDVGVSYLKLKEFNFSKHQWK